MLGVRANRVIGVAVLISGALAAVVAVMLTVQTPLVTPDFALRDTIIVLAGVVLGGMNRPIPATLGGFSIGFASGLLGGALPTNQSQYLPTFLFVAVILVLLVRPGGLFARRRGGGARMRRLVGAAGAARAGGARRRAALVGTLVSSSTQTYFTDALVKVAIVVALYVFIGNSGVLSFGHISFVALGAWTAGVLSVPRQREARDHAEPRAFLARPHDRQPDLARSSPRSSAGSARSSSALPLMRLSGLAAGIATFGVLEITHNLLRYEEKIGPGLNTFSSVPETTGLRQAAIGALARGRRSPSSTRAAASGACCARRARTRGRARGRGVGLPAAADRVHALGPPRRARRRPLRAPAAAEHRSRLSRSDVHHARDARRRRRDEPLGRGRRRARRQRARLVPRGRRERDVALRLARSTCPPARA